MDNILNLYYDDYLINVFLKEGFIGKNSELMNIKYDGIILFYNKNKKETFYKCYNYLQNYRRRVYSNFKIYIYIFGYTTDSKNERKIEFSDRTEMYLRLGLIYNNKSPFGGKINICEDFEELIKDIFYEKTEKKDFKCPLCSCCIIL